MMIGYLLAFVFFVNVGTTFSNTIDQNSRIINGSPTTTGKHPHQISLQVIRRGQWFHICGGSIVGKNWVVTAAHCVDSLRCLKDPADLSGNTIALANSGENFDGQTCTISGWGLTETGGPNQLQETDGVILTHNECLSTWGTDYDSSAHICIDNKNTGACFGDSGGPMVCVRGSTRVLAGLSSWGESRCITTFPEVYTRVPTYREWLDETMLN
ncbi:chymotrypsin B-like [Dreissena polymorpha]|uniref:chymotrypsin B-like n=1 Tax=Dreissena polymorpha TaxID=45954 RepID=UPI002264CAA9|nr:chymotrypsin B-like [Dreissena polymorpha]